MDPTTGTPMTATPVVVANPGQPPQQVLVLTTPAVLTVCLW